MARSVDSNLVLARRSFLLACAAACTAQTITKTTGIGRVFPSAAVRYPDPATETQILRLTDPQFSSRLATNSNRVVTNRGFLFSSDMAGSDQGSWQAFYMDMRNRAPRQLTESAALDPDSLALSPDARQFWHFDGPDLIETSLANPHRTRAIYRVPEGFQKTPGAAVNETGTHAALVEIASGDEANSHRLRVVDLAKSSATTVLESPHEILDPLFRPRHASLLYRSQEMFWMIHYDGPERQGKQGKQDKQKLPLPAGVPQARWSADGAELLYLNRPQDHLRLTTLEEFTPETAVSNVLANTSQFASFDANANASVIAGASGSKASPYLLLLIRAARRELTLAEHHSSDPRAVAPHFSPNSQFLVFGSDRHGKPAIYWIPVDKLVTETDSTE